VRAKELKRLNIYLHVNAFLRELIFAAGPIAVCVIIASIVYWFNQVRPPSVAPATHMHAPAADGDPSIRASLLTCHSPAVFPTSSR
jgi:hypothetical protein